MSRDPARAATQFFGGRVCLDFANTVDWRLTDQPQELIPDYPALITWSVKRGTLTRAACARLGKLAARDPDAAAGAVKDAHNLRSSIWAAADRLLAGQEVRLEPFNSRLAQLPSQPGLRPGDVRLVFALEGASLEEPLWPVLWSLTAVLTSEDAARLGSCEASGCGWYFVDESPSHTRRWCSSEVCGNRERARRAYAKRTRAAQL